jgi:hypothetical protein
MYGITTANCTGNYQTSVAVGRPSPTGSQNVTIIGGKQSDGGTGLYLDSCILAEWGAALDLYRINALVDTTGLNFNNTTCTTSVGGAANIPFAARMGMAQCQMRRRNDLGALS